VPVIVVIIVGRSISWAPAVLIDLVVKPELERSTTC